MKWQSDKQRAAEAECREIHDTWLSDVRLYRGDRCMIPKCDNPATAVHEICSGQFRMKCRREVAGLLWLCQPCHDKIQGMQFLHIALAIKLVADPWHFDADAVRKVLQPAMYRTADVFYLSDITQYLDFTGVI